MPQVSENFVPPAPGYWYKANGQVRPIRSGNTDAARGSKVLSAAGLATTGDRIIWNGGNLDLGAAQLGTTGVRIELNPRCRVISSHTDGVWNGLGFLIWPYQYNVEKGLRRWFNSLGQTAKTSSGLGMGGVDIVTVGHSRMEFGYGSGGPTTDLAGGGTVTYAEYLADKWTHILKVWLQDYYNPKGVVGGLGYVPCLVGSQSSTPDSRRIFTQTGTWTENTSNFGAHNGRVLQGAAGQTATLQLDGTAANALFRRSNVSSFEVCYRRYSGGGTLSIDVGDGSAPATGAGYTTGTVSTTGSNPAIPGSHSVEFEADPTLDNYFKVTAPGSGNVAQFDGMIFYHGDHDCGIRLHNVADWGIALRALIGTYHDSHFAGIKRFFTAEPADGDVGAFHGKLAIIDHIAQDVVAGTSPAQFKADYTVLVEELLACASKPCVLAYIPPLPSVGQDDYLALIEQIYQVADEHDNMAILNLDQKFFHATQSSDKGYDALGGYTVTDARHDSRIGHHLVAEEIFSVLKR